jgi:hypothetical protein
VIRFLAFVAVAGCGNGPSRSPRDAGTDAGVDAGDAAVDAGPPSPWETPRTWTLGAPFACPPAVADDDLLGELLGDLGLDWTVGIPRSRYDAFGGRIADDPTRLSHFHLLQEDVRLIPCFAGNMAGRADAAVASDHPLATLVSDMATQLDLTLTVGGPWPEIDASSPLVSALDVVWGKASWDRDAAIAAAAAVPLPVQEAAAHVLLGAVEAQAMRDAALPNMGDPARFDDYFEYGANIWLLTTDPQIDPDTPEDEWMFRGSEDGSTVLYEGGVRLAQAIDEADWVAAKAAGPFELFVDTPLGAVVLRGGGDDTYDADTDARLAGPLLLVVDTGGNDEYRIPAGATVDAAHGVAVHVDLGGNDRYEYAEVASPYDGPGLLPADAEGRYTPDPLNRLGAFSLSQSGRQGSGRLGYGVLLDLGGGDDVYRALKRSQGFANFGVGILWDDGGTDSYEGEAGVQGSAVVGIAIQYDGGGDDTYRSYQSSQGFGWISSYGLLYDRAGADHYELVVDSPVLFGSSQTAGLTNNSLGQGTAFGFRRDDTGHHLAGGLALIRDREGNDRYDGATFVQGVGYWMGFGVSADWGGDDRWNGIFYDQGATAHFALSAFLEGGGDDTYEVDRPANHSSMGLGHDYSVSFFVDDGGIDERIGPDRSIGAGKCHGMGIFVDNGGDDTYDADNRAIGWATDYDWAEGVCGTSATEPTYGFFLDIGGDDTYRKPDLGGYGDDRTWITDDPEDSTALELSGGIDRETASTFARAYGQVYEEGP